MSEYWMRCELQIGGGKCRFTDHVYEFITSLIIFQNHRSDNW